MNTRRRLSITALLLLSGLGYELIVVSNQAGVAFGHFPLGALRAVEEHLDDLLMTHGFTLTDCYWCPHHPQATVEDYRMACACRKPQPGLLQAAAAEHGISLEESWIIGDILDDVEAGKRAGCRAVLLDVGNETEWARSALRTPDIVAANLLEAAEGIMLASTPPTVGWQKSCHESRGFMQ